MTSDLLRLPHVCCDRRTVLSGLVATSIAGMPGAAVGAPAPHNSIDIHHHIVPPFYKDGARAWLTRSASNVDEVLAWTPERSLAAMDAGGVATSVLSISAPGLSFVEGAEAIALARRCNDYAAELEAAHPGRFRFFTALPMPDVTASIREMERVLAIHLPAGIGLLSNYGGRYLGDPIFAALFERAALLETVVYVHPTSAACCQGLVPGVIDPLIEFPVDTGRTIASLLWSGTFSRWPTLRFVFSHGGGILPMVAERVAAAGFVNRALLAKVPEGPRAALLRLYVDTASTTNAAAMAAMRSTFPDSRILFGTDYPWGDVSRTRKALRALDLPPAALAMIEHDNARKLLTQPTV